jgi:hypothetical protein
MKFQVNAADTSIARLVGTKRKRSFAPTRLIFKSDRKKVYIPFRTTPVATILESKNESPCLKANQLTIIKIFNHTPRNKDNGEKIIVLAYKTK